MGSIVCVGGWISVIPLPKRGLYPCMGTEMWLQIQFSPIFCSQTRFGLNHTHNSQIKGGWKFAPKGLVRGPVCWAKMVHFWKPWKLAFCPPPGCRESFSMLPGHALSNIMVWNAGAGPWWAATAEVNPNPCNIHTGLKHLFQWGQLIVCQTHSKSVKPHLQGSNQGLTT